MTEKIVAIARRIANQTHDQKAQSSGPDSKSITRGSELFDETAVLTNIDESSNQVFFTMTVSEQPGLVIPGLSHSHFDVVGNLPWPVAKIHFPAPEQLAGQYMSGQMADSRGHVT
mmetsp:Transcript_35029/g.80997  ORF Transcript_35029/g.80997 Transcript_35029/m.80997 type:complete len:115 (-) Transcript_35029:543-887(-)